MKKAFYRISILIVLLLIGIGQSKADGYKVTIETDGNGNVSASPADNIAKGSTVTLTVTPNTGYLLNEIKAYRYSDTERADARRRSSIIIGEEISLATVTANQQYRLTMPDDDVIVQATFRVTLSPADVTQPVSQNNPYIINNVQNMLILSEMVNAGEAWTKNTYFKVADGVTELDFSGVEGYESIGTNNGFQSNFDGNGVTIKNLTVSGKDYVGLFGSVVGARTISNIRIDGSCSFTGTGNYVGAVVGCVNNASLSNCHNDGADVTGTSYVGGIMGGYYRNFRGMSDCSVGMQMEKGTRMTVSGTSYVGAMIGNAGGTMTNNWYNGMTVVVKAGDKEYTGFGYGWQLSDAAGIRSATGGAFPQVNPGHNAQGLTWSYDLYTNTFTVVGDPDPGYVITSVTVSYTDADGNAQTVTRNEEQIAGSRSFDVPFHPTGATATYYGVLRPADETKAVSATNPYLIQNVQDMLTLSRYVKAGSAWTAGTWFKVADGVTELDFSGVEGYEPIGTGNGFQSTFDGNGVIVKNLTVSGKDYVGLFGIVTGGQGISNIRIDGSCSFTGTGNYVGAVVGYVNNPSASLSNCHNDGADVTGTAYVGGIMGGYYRNFYGMSDCSAGMRMEKGTRMTVSATSYVGAMMGNAGGTMTNNWYNGITVVVKAGDKEYTGFGYGRQLSDAAGIRSATGGAFPQVNPGHNAQGLTWDYDLYTKTFTVVGDPDPGYVITSVTVSYTDADGNAQTVTRNEEQIAGSRSFDVPFHPTGATATYYGVLRPADETKAVSATNPYLIHNVQDMLTLSKCVKAGSAWTRNTWIKVADGVTVLDFSGVEDFEPIGTGNSFNGSFDGNGVTIKNLRVYGDTNVGLFGYADQTNGIISNITIDPSCMFTGTGNYVGSILGRGNHITVSNCSNLGASVSGSTAIGGIVGEVSGYYNSFYGTYASHITDCVNEASVNGTTYVGGIAGNVGSYSTIENCRVGMKSTSGSSIFIDGTQYVGAVSGSFSGSRQTSNYYNGKVVRVQAGNNYYTGHGYGINLADNNNTLSMTGGYCGVTNENNGRNVEWEYDPWSKEFVVSGYGAITNSTSGIAPDIIKDDIESLIISYGVTGIGSKAFSGWTSLNSITFDGCSLTTAANDAFDGCTSMAYGSVTVNGQNPFARIETTILSVVTNGILNGEGNLDLGVQQQGDSFLWQGGTFGDYDLGEMLLEGVSFNATKQWTTYYSPMNLAMPDGVRAFVVDNFDDYGVEITEIYYIPAGVGVLLYCDNAYDNITTDIYNGYTTSYSSLLEGAFYDMTLDQDEGYILYKNEFILSKGGSLPAYRCYLPAGNRYNARGLSARLSLTKPSGNSNATEITDIPKDTKADDNDSWYTINGHKLSEQPTQKGVYIHNGRKVVVK